MVPPTPSSPHRPHDEADDTGRRAGAAVRVLAPLVRHGEPRLVEPAPPVAGDWDAARRRPADRADVNLDLGHSDCQTHRFVYFIRDSPYKIY
jgi:hypothetical protein